MIRTAVLLCGGEGTRLRPLTNDIPKSMVEIDGKPLLWYLLRLLEHYGLRNVWINIGWKKEKIVDYVGDGTKWNLSVRYTSETRTNGTAAALVNQASGIRGDLEQNNFVLILGDALTNYNLEKFTQFHEQNQAILTMSLWHSDQPWTCGVVQTDSKGKVTRFQEKPPKDRVFSDTVNGGIYVCDKKLLTYIDDQSLDLDGDVSPKLVKEGLVYGVDTGDYLLDIGTHERLAKAREEIHSISFPWNNSEKFLNKSFS